VVKKCNSVVYVWHWGKGNKGGGGGSHLSHPKNNFTSVRFPICVPPHVKLIPTRKNLMYNSVSFKFFFAGRVCPRGQMFSDCVSSCAPSCTSPQPAGVPTARGQCREECVGGCECPPGLYLHQGNCLKKDDCPCFHRRRTYQPGDTIQKRCNTW